MDILKEIDIDRKIAGLCERDHCYDYSLTFESVSETWVIEIIDELTGEVLISEDCYNEHLVETKQNVLLKFLRILKVDKIDALCRLVEILIKDKYTMPGTDIICNDEIKNLLKEIQK